LDGLRHIARVTGQPLTAVLSMGFDRPHRLLTGRPNGLTEGTPARILFVEGGRIEGFDGHSWRVLPDRALRPAGGASRD